MSFWGQLDSSSSGTVCEYLGESLKRKGAAFWVREVGGGNKGKLRMRFKLLAATNTGFIFILTSGKPEVV